ncbi:hypothetical protein GCM10010306_001450 [Streptomyces umbrinus]|nr:hypothetical protein GCM10010306_001450 [Streptomyces umbrinus]
MTPSPLCAPPSAHALLTREDAHATAGANKLSRSWRAPLIQGSPFARRREDVSSIESSLPQLLIHLLHISQFKMPVLVRSNQNVQCAVSPKPETSRYSARRILIDEGHRAAPLCKQERFRLPEIVSVLRRPGGRRLHLATHGVHFTAVREYLGLT